jgi:hypothetical protein
LKNIFVLTIANLRNCRQSKTLVALADCVPMMFDLGARTTTSEIRREEEAEVKKIIDARADAKPVGGKELVEGIRDKLAAMGLL